MNLTQWLESARFNREFMANVTHWHVTPPKAAQFAPFPDSLDPRLVKVYAKRGVTQLYTHQHDAVEAVAAGKNIVVVTPTASGKTLCYNLPVLDAILKDPAARAIYLFPTKALSADQVSELYEVIEQADIAIKTYTYDGDTPAAARKAIRQAGHIVVTNPDMLHSGILPHHTKWIQLFENLRYIVIDELHMYRGVFGSHLCNILRRLKRICEFYGSHPQFICCSATIANPEELAHAICDCPMTLIDNNGAPSGEKHFIFYNPPVINRQLGIRKGALGETRAIAEDLIQNHISTIVFARSRIQVEVLVNHLKQITAGRLGDSGLVRGYRSGYLASQRRQIEQGLRSGRILGVVSTNALELGIDIGSLEACVICGYPGTISGTWQQAGRAGRRQGASLTVMVANSSPLSQYIIAHPEYFFERSPEHGLIYPDNLYILLNHLKCAAYELPFADGDTYAGQDIKEILGYLEESGVLRHAGSTWHWSAEDFPASEIDLRSASNENFLIIDITHNDRKVIGEMDRFTVPMLLHEHAIYMHEGRQYQVEELDFPNKKAYIRSVDVDYYTDANLEVNLRVLDVLDEDKDGTRSWGEVLVTSLVTMFKKMKLDTGENLGSGNVNLPELEMHTTAYWACFEPELYPDLTQEQLQQALLGASNVLGIVAPMTLMCDPKDISVLCQVRAPFTGKPTIYLYDGYPGGIGFSEKLFHLHDHLWQQAASVIGGCDCLNGCPSCVGPDGDKRLTLRLLEGLRHDSESKE